MPAAVAARPRPGVVLLRRLGLPLVVAAALIVLWDVVVRVFAIPAFVIPTPLSVWQALVKDHAMLLDNAVPTIVESLGGFLLGNVVAEWIGTNKGLGYLIVLTTYDFRTALLYAAMAVTSAVALAFFFLVSVLEWLLVRWER